MWQADVTRRGFCVAALGAHAFAQQPGQRVQAAAIRRVALLIGNAKYADLPLANPLNDVTDLKTALERLQFEVTVICNATQTKLTEAVSKFSSSLLRGDYVFFHYSGHGLQIDAENYFVPVGFAARTEADVVKMCVPFTLIKTALEKSPARVVLMTLDACRDNPFQGEQQERRGLAAIEAGLGSYIAFAAAPGRTAADNKKERNGLFTKHLLEGLDQPVTISEMFRWVRRQVYEGSGERQRPYLHDQVIGNLTFRGGEMSRIDASIAAAVAQLMDDGRAAFHTGNYESAYEAFDRASRQSADNPFAHHAAGTALAALGRMSQAAEHFRIAIQLKHDFAASYLSRGVVYARARRYDLAIQDFKWAIENDPRDAVAYWRRGHVLLLTRKLEDAERDFTTAISLNGTDPQPYCGRGQVKYRLGQLADALDDLNQAIRRKKDFGEAFWHRARVKEFTGDKAGAEQDRREAERLGFLQ